MENPRRVLAIGDIHDRRDLLDALLDAISPTAADRLVFLGDYIDRGPDSAGVLTRLSNYLKTAAGVSSGANLMARRYQSRLTAS